jgi:hypothetical protein
VASPSSSSNAELAHSLRRRGRVTAFTLKVRCEGIRGSDAPHVSARFLWSVVSSSNGANGQPRAFKKWYERGRYYCWIRVDTPDFTRVEVPSPPTAPSALFRSSGALRGSCGREARGCLRPGSGRSGSTQFPDLKNKNFPLADTIRNKLTEIGITLEDGPDGTRWRRS